MAGFQYHLTIVLICCSGVLTVPYNPKVLRTDQSTVRLISALFRHGDRTVDQKSGESYPNDLYKNFDTYPVGDGQLTNSGKQRTYRIGKMLRERYDKYLGNVYYQPNVYARSTMLARCKMTLQLILAGLYPPADIQKWDPELAWQPMNTIYTLANNDGLLIPFICRKYMKTYADVMQTEEVKKEISQFSDLMKEMSVYTGKNVTTISELFGIYTTLTTQQSLNLTAPVWSQDIFPYGRLLDAAILEHNLLSYNDDLIKLNGGVLLYRMINDMNEKIDGTLEDRKINIFVAHDVTVAAMLKALGLNIDSPPQFASGVIVELHEQHSQYFVKVLRYLGIPDKLVEVNIPGCEILCPYDKFVQLSSTRIPSGEDPICPIIIDEDLRIKLP